MVVYFTNNFCLLAQQAASPDSMPPPTRAAAYMALIGILLLGLLLVVIILLGGHWVRRWGSYRRGPAVPADFIPDAQQPSKSPNQDSKPPADDRSCSDTIRPDDTMVS